MATTTETRNDRSGGAATPRETDAETTAQASPEKKSTGQQSGAKATDGTSSGKESGGKAGGEKSDASGSDGSSRSLLDSATTIAGRLESTAAEKAESAVSGRGFATVLGWAAENLIALTRIGGDVADLAVRNLRLAGRKDLARIGAQQARTEDKLERLLQEVERLEAELRRARGEERA
jgi:hypothetical protein